MFVCIARCIVSEPLIERAIIVGAHGENMIDPLVRSALGDKMLEYKDELRGFRAIFAERAGCA